MRRPLSVLLFSSAIYLLPVATATQQPVQSAVPVRDPQAVLTLTQALNAAGGASAISTVQDFTATGNITYYWAGEEVTGTVTIRGARPDQFRLDAQLPNGVRSWCVNAGQGTIKEANGKQSRIPLHSGANLGSLTFPYGPLFQALIDTSYSIELLGQESVGGHQLARIRLRPNYPTDLDPSGTLQKWSTREYLIDSSTFAVVTLSLVARSNDSPVREYQQEIAFSDYRLVSGVLFPFTIAETISAQKTWVAQLNSVSFNSGLSDSDFRF